MQNAVGVDLELHAHLGHALGLRLELEREPPQAPVVRRLFTLTLQHVDEHLLLVVGHRRERLAALHWDRRVARDDHVHQPAERLDAQRERRHVEQQHAAEVAGQNPRLNRRAQRDRLVRILRRVQLRPTAAAPEHSRGKLTHERHPRLSADEDHLVEIAAGQAGVGERLEAILARARHDRLGQALELFARQCVFKTKLRRQKRQRDGNLVFRGQPRLGLLHRLGQARPNRRVGGGAWPARLANLLRQMLDQHAVDVVAAQPRVAAGGQHLKHALVQLENREVERPAAEIVHGYFRFFLQRTQPVGQRGGGRLVDDALDPQPGQLAGIARGVALGVVEIGRHRDHRRLGPVNHPLGSNRPERLEDLCGQLLRRPVATVQRHRHRPAALGANGVRRRGGG